MSYRPLGCQWQCACGRSKHEQIPVFRSGFSHCGWLAAGVLEYETEAFSATMLVKPFLGIESLLLQGPPLPPLTTSPFLFPTPHAVFLEPCKTDINDASWSDSC